MKPSIINALKWMLPHSENKPLGKYPIDYAKVAAGEPWKYVLGTIYNRGTQELLERLRKKYYSNWNIKEYNRLAKFKYGYICTDCQGVMDAYFTQVEKIKTDVNADMNYRTWCGTKSSNMQNMPKLLGLAVYMSNGSGKVTHVGFVCGFDNNGEPLVYEAKGYKDDVVITRFKDRAWNRWGKMDKKFDYSEAEKLTSELLKDMPTTKPATESFGFTVYCRSPKGGNVNLRYSPSQYHDVKVIASIKNGTKMLATTNKAVDGWYKVKVDGVVGYMNNKYVKMK